MPCVPRQKVHYDCAYCKKGVFSLYIVYMAESEGVHHYYDVLLMGILSEINLDSSTTGKYNVNLCNKGSRNFQLGPVMLIFSDWLNVFFPLWHAAAGYSVYFFFPFATARLVVLQEGQESCREITNSEVQADSVEDDIQ